MRTYRFTSFLLVLLLCALSDSIFLMAAGSPDYVELTDWHVLQGDTLVMNISPVVERLSVDTFSLTPSLDFRVSYFLDYGGISAVRMTPLSEGLYNLTIKFETETAWSYTVGVLTSKPSFYSEYADVSVAEGGSFVRFYSRTIEASSGNSSLTLMLNSHGDNPDPAPPDSTFVFLTLPESLSLVVFVAATGVLGYTNAFLMADSYFRRKKDALSRGRWALMILMLAASLLVTYQLYHFAIV